MFDSITSVQLGLFFQSYKLLHYKKHTLILQTHDSPPSVFYVKSGYLRVYRISDQGEELTLTILKPKDFFPLTYGLTLSSRLNYLETLTPLELWKAPALEFTSYIKTQPELYKDLTAQMVIHFDSVISRMEQLLFSSASVKIASILFLCALRLGEKTNDTLIMNVPLTHKDIATMVGLTRETTSLEIKKLENRGLIKRQRKQLIITDVKRFEREGLLITKSEPYPLHFL